MRKCHSTLLLLYSFQHSLKTCLKTFCIWCSQDGWAKFSELETSSCRARLNVAIRMLCREMDSREDHQNFSAIHPGHCTQTLSQLSLQHNQWLHPPPPPPPPIVDCSPCCPLKRGSTTSKLGQPGSAIVSFPKPSDCWTLNNLLHKAPTKLFTVTIYCYCAIHPFCKTVQLLRCM